MVREDNPLSCLVGLTGTAFSLWKSCCINLQKSFFSESYLIWSNCRKEKPKVVVEVVVVEDVKAL